MICLCCRFELTFFLKQNQHEADSHTHTDMHTHTACVFPLLPTHFDSASLTASASSQRNRLIDKHTRTGENSFNISYFFKLVVDLNHFWFAKIVNIFCFNPKYLYFLSLLWIQMEHQCRNSLIIFLRLQSSLKCVLLTDC